MHVVQAANQGLRFLLELCALAALGWSGYQVNASLPVRIAAAVALPLAAAGAWSVWGAPASSRQLGTGPRLVLELAVFGGAALALWLAGRQGIALGFAAVCVVNRALMFAWDQ